VFFLFVIAIKHFFLSFWTSMQRSFVGSPANPEDNEISGTDYLHTFGQHQGRHSRHSRRHHNVLPAVAPIEHPEVVRCVRAQQNEIESNIPFLLTFFAWIISDSEAYFCNTVSPLPFYLGFYFLSRFVATLCHLNNLQPFRSISWAAGVIVTICFALNALVVVFLNTFVSQ